MAFKLRYRIAAKFDEVILNKRVMLTLAVLAPIMFATGVFCLKTVITNDFVMPRFPQISFTPGKVLGLFSKPKKEEGAIKIEMPVVSTQDGNDSIFSHNLFPMYSEAKQLIIETAGIDLKLMEAGVTDDGILEVPTNWTDGGWYKYGARPGEIGNVIINAHYDDNYGRPAAFWQLKNVKVGDKVLLLDGYGKRYTYTVTDSYLVSINDPNRLKVFADEDNKATLTMLTCGGIWLSGESTYDKRLVVKAELLN